MNMGWIRKKMMNKLFILFFIFSCGFYSTKGSLPAHIDSIHINPIINESVEYSVSKQLLDDIIENLINENIINITGWDSADSRLDIKILEVKDTPNIYGVNSSNEYSQVDEWKITVVSKVIWLDVIKNETLFESNIQSYGIYGNISDMNIDGIDNDGDNLFDSNDSDEFGPPREGALRIAVEKLSREIINQITSTW